MPSTYLRHPARPGGHGGGDRHRHHGGGARRPGRLTGIDRSTANRDPLNVLERDRFLDFGAGHGTFVTGVIQQVAGDIAEIEVYQALDSDGVGSDVDVACALLEAVESGARIVNLSVGTESGDGEPLAMKVALEILGERDDDVLIVAAAGNSGLDGNHKSWPAAFEGVVAVAGLDADGKDGALVDPWRLGAVLRHRRGGGIDLRGGRGVQRDRQ